MIERRILIALITQTEFLRQIQKEWNSNYIESATARLISGWCWEYFKKRHKAPLHDIENIYIQKLRKGNVNKDLAEEIEQEILPSLSEEYEKGELNVTYLIEQTRDYFKERQIVLHAETLQALLLKNKVDEAEKEVQNFRLNKLESTHELELSEPETLNKIDSAFDSSYQSVLTYTGALGQFWNDQLVRGGLVAILAPEKRGKTFMLIEFMMRAYRQKKKVVFFQAGDMTENQMIVRLAIYIAKKSNKEKFCGTKYIPVRDCINNQLDTCTKKIRECSFGIFNVDAETLRSETKLETIKKAYDENPNYKPCFNCSEYAKNKWGVPWINKVEIKNPLTAREAKRNWQKFFIQSKRQIKLLTYSNKALTTGIIRQNLNRLKTEEDFVADLVLIDYADLLGYEGTSREFRHQQNEIWMDLRAISQEYDCLVIPPTQADADSYKKDRLGLDNFSEDKRKFAHVTAMYGLNQDTRGREKEIGLIRINKIVVREDDFHQSHEVYVLQKLDMGRPYLGSFF